MTQHDQLHRYLFENYAVRGELVTVSETLEQILANHTYPQYGQNGAGGAVGRHQSADRDAEVSPATLPYSCRGMALYSWR